MVRLSVLVMFLLGGCASTAPVTTTACPPISAASPELQHQAAAELRAPPRKPALEWVMGDWIQMRDRLRKCSS